MDRVGRFLEVELDLPMVMAAAQSAVLCLRCFGRHLFNGGRVSKCNGVEEARRLRWNVCVCVCGRSDVVLLEMLLAFRSRALVELRSSVGREERLNLLGLSVAIVVIVWLVLPSVGDA
jgi:hypothetical protein